MRISFKRLLRSFSCALQGIRYVLSQQSFFLMLFISIVILSLGFWLQISYFEWLIIIFLIGFILCLEILNSVLEKTLDFLEPNTSDKIKEIKDLIAGAVFLACLTAVVLGFIIFLPKILSSGNCFKNTLSNFPARNLRLLSASPHQSLRMVRDRRSCPFTLYRAEGSGLGLRPARRFFQQHTLALLLIKKCHPEP